METCVLIPRELSLILLPHGAEGKPLEMGVTLWANCGLKPGVTFSPDDGELRLDRLEIYSRLSDKDVRNRFGCFDEVLDIDGHQVRHCNWVRFLRSASDLNEVNLVARTVKDKGSVFQIVKPVPPNGELKVFFDVPVSTVGPKREPRWTPQEVPKSFSGLQTSGGVTSPKDFGTPLELRAVLLREKSISDSTTYTSPSSGFDSPSNNCLYHSATTPDVSEDKGKTDSPPQEPQTKSLDTIIEPLHRSFEDSAAESDADDSTPDDTSVSFPSPATLPPSKPEAEASRRRPPPAISGGALCQTARRKEKAWLPCDVCGKKFDRPSLLKRHERTHTGEKPHACDICGKAFSTSSSLNTHRRIHSGEKPHECQVCGKCFTASSNLYYHRMTHKKEKPHKCHLCSKSFPTPGDLKSHMYVHSGSWPFKCNFCDRGFSKHANLKNHLQLHSGQKPYQCQLCGKTFALQCNLRTHVKMHEGESQERCSTCNRCSPLDARQCLRCKGHDRSTTLTLEGRLKAFSIESLVDTVPKPRHNIGSTTSIRDPTSGSFSDRKFNAPSGDARLNALATYCAGARLASGLFPMQYPWTTQMKLGQKLHRS